MAGLTSFPTALDDDTSLLDVTDGVSALLDEHHNNTKEAVKAIEAKLGIYSTSAPTSLDYRLGSATNSHKHDGASGHGVPINPSTINNPSGGIPSGLTLADHLVAGAIHGGQDGLGVRHIVPMHMVGSAVVGSKVTAPVSFGRTLRIESVTGSFRRGPSGATTAFDVLVGPTSLWEASQGLRPIFPAGATYYSNASTNFQTYPSGAILTLDVDAVGSNDPGQDLNIVFIFRD